MSIFRISDYYRKPETKRKEKLPTKSKTAKCTFCGKSGTTLHFGKEKRTLCREHLIQLNRKHEQYDVQFTKANRLEMKRND